MLDGEITDMIEAQSLRHNRDYIDIYSSSWGPEDDGKTVEGPGLLTEQTLAAGAKLVRYQYLIKLDFFVLNFDI